MDRIAVVAGALLLLGGPTPAQQGQRSPASRVDIQGLPDELKPKLADFVLNAEAHLTGDEFGLKPPDPAQFMLRIRTPKPNDVIVPAGLSYTAGTAALTFYARSPAEALNGGGTFDPLFTVLDMACETGWATRIRSVWLLPSAVRNGLDRHFSQRLLEVLQKEEEKDPNAPRWPGSAKVRKGSLESLPAGHPLVQDRDRVTDLFDRLEKRPDGQKELQRILASCSELQATAPMVMDAVNKLLAPVLAEGPKTLLPEVEFATREPWPGTGERPLAMRMNGIGGEPSQTSIVLRLAFGEQRTTPTEFQDWNAGGAPTLLFRAPLAGNWYLTGVEICGRRIVGEKDDSAGKLFWVVVLDERFHELSRWPYLQSAIPAGKAAFVRLPFSSPPELPKEFWFVALEAEDPGPGTKLEICVRPGSLGEHCFRSIPNRKLSGLAAPVDKATGAVAPVDFALFVDVAGRELDRMVTPMILFQQLQQWCKPKK
jgi:hypothetical protein